MAQLWPVNGTRNTSCGKCGFPHACSTTLVQHRRSAREPKAMASWRHILGHQHLQSVHVLSNQACGLHVSTIKARDFAHPVVSRASSLPSGHRHLGYTT